MEKKMWLVNIGVVVLLVLTYIPTITSQPIYKNVEDSFTNTLTLSVPTMNIDVIEIRVFHIPMRC